VQLGELDITPLSDGYFKMPSTYFGVDDWGVHKELAGEDGMLEVPIGCFVIRGGGLTVLIDAGLGPVDLPGTAHGGDLPGELARAGVKPEDVDLIVLTHLHLDHIGWTIQNGEIQFPNATIRFGEQDLGQFVHTETPDPMSAPTINAFMEHGKVEPITSDGEIAPGISTIHAPGHTLGHRCVVLSSGDERVLLLGDAVTCPVQLEESDWGAMSDVDPAMSKRTREALFKELEASGDVAVGAHFPGLQFGRVLKGEGKRYFA
jgi:glyoxylase-like metal-dependent hydrolase (beta-lactamase superfamily II)